MSLRVGFHVEGTDVLILCALLERLLGLERNDVEPVPIQARPITQGCADLVKLVPEALSVFRKAAVAAAVLAMDNDGDIDLRLTGSPEDYAHPRHWNHTGVRASQCRFCQLTHAVAAATAVNSELAFAPAIIAVPTEMIEAWLLVAAGLDKKGSGDLEAEQMPKRDLKPAFYGCQRATQKRVREHALPLLARLTDVEAISQHSRSFALFAEQVDGARATILACVT